MAKYKVTFKKSVAKDLRNIANRDVQRILAQIDLLADNPRSEGCLKLSNMQQYRVRVGLYRIIYEIQDARLVVQVVKVGHRTNIYKGN
ncbi:MAG: type II toxin-antitoxin system RelE/ParE family toxin [Porticoccaceae bacterium]|jgi:mRNA interferase RelE/StbE|nr:type II toxin-antitoxin system RelE/ParE family toxin [Porticoccaceae bacterium]